jgi:hypothetical protein
MSDGLSKLCRELLSGSYDCVDRIALNAYFGMGHRRWWFPWWRALTEADDILDNAHLMRLAGRFSRRHLQRAMQGVFHELGIAAR